MNLDIPSNWQVVPFKKIIEDSAFGPRFSSDNYSENGDIATLRTTDLDDQGRISYESMPLANLKDEKFKKHFLKKGDLVITRSGTCGIAAVFEQFSKDVLPGAFLIRFRLNEKAHPYFYRYFFNSEYGREHILSVATGAVQQNLNITNLEMLLVPLPPKGTQEKIVSRISTYDELIENNSRRIEILEEMARRIYREWFVHFRYPGHEEDELVDSGTELGEIPEGWGVVELGKVLDINKGKNITKKIAEPGDVPVVAGGLTPAYTHDTPNTKHPVITVSASGANAGYVNLYEVDVWASDCSYVDLNATNNIYYYYSLMADSQDKIFHMQHGSAQPHVYPKDLNRLLIIDPIKGLKKEFEEFINPIFSQRKTLMKKNKRLKETRNLLLPKLISGKIDVEKVNVK